MYANVIEKPRSPRLGTGQHVLVVVGDPRETELLSTTLGLAGYRVGTADTGAEGMARLVRHRFDLIVWDSGLPGQDTLARGRRLPAADRPPMLFLATCDSLQALVPELGPGTEDYVTKPLRIAEVLARAEVLLRGRPGRNLTQPSYGDLVLDDATCRASRGARPLDLTPAEYRLLRHLLANADHVLSKEQISRYVWGEYRGDQAIEKLVSRLRRKVDQEDPALIHTRRGFGYRLGRGDG
ncbi:response regulator transcription factor [Streptomyces sp. NPDC019531]|uniref:response regulator transcription factor n=1 Tax=Streptomyces sp. NPDC019531 TaxID=3365062 RepID=UPI00384F9DC4